MGNYKCRQESQKEFDGLEIVKVTWVNVPQYKVEAL